MCLSYMFHKYLEKLAMLREEYMIERILLSQINVNNFFQQGRIGQNDCGSFCFEC